MHLLLKIRYVYRIFSGLSIELKIVLISLAVVIGLPIFTVVLMANAGLAPVAAALVLVDKINHLVSVKDTKGNVLRTFQATTAWPGKGAVTTEFGGTTLFQKFHTGIDIAGKEGDPITVFMAGKVVHVEHDAKKSGYGLHVIVDHGDGITSVYGHMSKVLAAEGQDVQPGDVIGLEGHTGHVQGDPGTHLHFEVRVAALPVDPRSFMIGDPPR